MDLYLYTDSEFFSTEKMLKVHLTFDPVLDSHPHRQQSEILD